MTKARETINNYLLASAIFLLPFVFPLKASAEILERKVISSGKEYSMTIDTERQEYSLQPDVGEAEARNALASYILDDFADNIKEKRDKLNDKTAQFLWENPSEMQLEFSESDLTLPQNILAFQPYDIPKLDIDAWKKADEISFKFNLESQNYSFDWYKYNSIIAFYPKDRKIIGRGDEAYVLGQEEDEFGMRNIEEDNSIYNREVGGLLLDAIIKRLIQEGKKNPAATIPFLGAELAMKLEDKLAEDVKVRREKIVEHLKGRYKYRYYSPFYLNAIHEQGRQVSLKFDKNPNKIYFFVNADVFLRKPEAGTQSRKEGNLLKLIEVNTNEVTGDTTAGKIINHGKLIGKTLDDFLSEYENKKQLKNFNFREKARLYENLSNWNAQIQPFLNMLSSLKDTEIKGNLTELPEHQKFRHEADSTIKAGNLNMLIDGYFFTKNYLPYLSSPRKTFDTYKKAMLTRDFRLRDKTRYNAQITRIEKNWIDNKDDKGARKFVSDLEFIREIPYTLEMHKELIRNSVEAELQMFMGNYRAYFIRTKEGWKLDTTLDSDISLVREVYSIMNEIEKNHPIQERIIRGDIPIDVIKPTIFPAHYSNFEKLNIYKESTNSFSIKTSNPASYPLRLDLKKVSGKLVLYHHGPDRKDDGGLVKYNPEKGIASEGDIFIFLDSDN
jgi:hypothetical protein